ncbi:hypothetical protein F2981_03430 [Sinorhizobium meliloti]|nr:hypothetical protein [Sinorhizobium meliloti]
MGLDGLLSSRVADLTGIVNASTDDTWDRRRTAIPAITGPARLNGAAGNRKALEERFGLEKGPGPIFCVISRLTWQKGMDLVAEAADDIVALGGSSSCSAPAIRRWKARLWRPRRATAGIWHGDRL